MKKITLLLSAMLMTVMSFGAVVTFDADADKGNATDDYNQAAAYTITKNGVTIDVTKGCLGTYNNEMHYRIYKNQTITITSTAGDITSVQFTCTAKDDAKYGPGCISASVGNYTYSAEVGNWSGSASSVVFTATPEQVRASQIVVAIDGEVIPGGDNGGGNDNDSTGTVVPPAEGVITCAQAVEICKATGETATTDTYTIRGYVTEIKEAYTDQHNNVSCWMADEKGGGQVFLAFRVKPINETDKAVKVNDYIEVKGKLVNYYGNTPETTAGGSMTIITVGEEAEKPTLPEGLTGDGTKENPFSVEDVLTLNNQFAGPYYVKAFIVGQVVGAAISTGSQFEAPFSPSTNNDGTVNTYNTNLLVASSADVADVAKCVPVQLPAGDLRTNFNLPENPDMDSQEVLICGSFAKYFGVAGIKSTSSIELLGDAANEVTVRGLQYADAYYYEEEGVGYYEIDMYKDVDPDTYEYTYPEVYVAVEAKSKTALNGTYDLLYAGYWTSANDSVMMGKALGTLTIENVDSESNYSFKGSFEGEDGKTYKFNQVLYVWAYDVDNDEDITLVEGATAVENVTTEEKATATKVLRKGQLLIKEGDKFYNVLGAEVK